jgi:hypothetical protein
MLPNFSQYPSQGLLPQIPGLQGIGVPQLNSVLGQPGVYGNPWSGHELGQQVQVQPWAGQINPFGHSPLSLQSQSVVNSPIHTSIPAIPALLQIAQQLAIQCAISQQLAQQVGIAVQQLANQIANQFAPQGLQGAYPGFNPQMGFNPQVQAWGPNRPPTIQ